MTKILTLVLFMTLPTLAIAQTNCTAEDVRSQLIAKTGEIFEEIESSFGIPMCTNSKDEAAAVKDTWNPECVSPTAVVQSIYGVKWNEEEQTFMGSDYLNWQCAASVQCWAWLQADCDGSFQVLSAGED